MAELSAFAQVVKERAIALSYERLYDGRPWHKASPEGRIDAESSMHAYDVLRALDSLLGEFVAGITSSKSSTHSGSTVPPAEVPDGGP